MQSNSPSSQVTLKGFLYQTNEGQWILYKNPHLKSCCVGRIDRDSPIFLEGDFSIYSKQQLMTVKGRLRTELAFLQNSLYEKKLLSEIEISEQKSFPIYSFLILGSALCIFFLKKRIVKYLRLLLP
jgi:hypothetical protein